MRSIVRRDTGEGYQLFLEGLAEASGIETPSRADLAKLDRKRPKKGSNDEWEHPHDPDARITKMKDGRTRMGHKLEQAVDMSSGAVCGLTVQPTTGGDSSSLPQTLAEARGQLERVGVEVRELVCDKGYHSNATMKRLAGLGVRGYVSEPNRGRRSWKRDQAAQMPTYANRRRVRGARGKGLLRARGGAEAGARLRPHAHHRRHAPDAPSRAREHPQASAGARGRVQPRAPDAAPVRLRHAEEPAGEKCVHASNRSPRERFLGPFPAKIARSGPPGGRLGPDIAPTPPRPRWRNSPPPLRRNHIPRAAARFCHGLLVQLRPGCPTQSLVRLSAHSPLLDYRQVRVQGSEPTPETPSYAGAACRRLPFGASRRSPCPRKPHRNTQLRRDARGLGCRSSARPWDRD